MAHSLRHSVYVGALAIVLALSGIFVSFASREVISRGITLSTTVLLVMLGSGALLAGLSARRSNASIVQVWVSAILGALVVAAMLLALAFVESSVDLRFVFANLTQPVSQTLTF